MQVPIFELLRKFDGQRVHDDIKLGRRKYRITRLPQFLVLHVKRFLHNRFFTEKNPTIVNFPVKNMELKDTIPVPPGERSLPSLGFLSPVWTDEAFMYQTERLCLPGMTLNILHAQVLGLPV